MRIKELFTVPEGTKVTEKVFTRVMVSSVFSILLCMVCLVSTTWAYFTVSIENAGNVIQIATVTADVSVTGAAGDVSEVSDGRYQLDSGTYTAHIKVDSDGEGPVYVVISVDSSKYYYLRFDKSKMEATQKFQIGAESQVGTEDQIGTEGQIGTESQVGTEVAEVSFSVSWVVKPVSATEAPESITVGEVLPPEGEPPAGSDTSTEETPPAEDTSTEVPAEPAPEPPADVPAEPAPEPSTDENTTSETDPVEPIQPEPTEPSEPVEQTEATEETSE